MMQILKMFIRMSAVLAMVVTSHTHAQVNANTAWQSIVTSNGSSATARHEATAIAVDGKLYLMGGRGNRPVEVYDPASNSWRVVGNTPLEIHHFQPVVLGTKIYVIAAFTCCYPNEPSIADIHVFDTVTEQWSIIGTMPEARTRGAAAAVVWQGDIYVVGGNTAGHNGGAVAWFDRYDPETETWQVLPDAPNARDHFAAVIVNGQLVAAGGRATDQPNVFANTIAATDIYDFSTGVWRSGASIPNPRAGAVTAGAGSELVIAGGESSGRTEAHDTTEAYDINLNQWRTLQPLSVARHSGGGAVLGTSWHVVAGNTATGGGAETNQHETLELGIAPDQDNDGLSDSDETSMHNTNPNLSDTDGDGAIDGDEIDAGTDPLVTDSDSDGLSDGAELNIHNTNPLVTDSDNDGVSDADEIAAGTDPLSADSSDENSEETNPSEPTDPSTNPSTVTTPTAKSGGALNGLILMLMGVGYLSRKRA